MAYFAIKKYLVCRFDHSPCDPTIKLKGCPSELFACAACGQHFQTKEAWKQHLESKVYALFWLCYVFKLFWGGRSFSSVVLVPRCPHLLPAVTASLRPINESCVLPVLRATFSSTSVMSVCSTWLPVITSQSHSSWMVTFVLNNNWIELKKALKKYYMRKIMWIFYFSPLVKETKGRALPVPIPQYVKNRLITLCKDATFSVRCSLCHKVLTSHQAAQAHFK